jgi:hypothetical protein
MRRIYRLPLSFSQVAELEPPRRVLWHRGEACCEKMAVEGERFLLDPLNNVLVVFSERSPIPESNIPTISHS